MSRNVEKSNSILVRYQELKAQELGGFKDFSRYKRPKRVGSVRNLKEALEWRRQIAREISDKVTRIYDVSLSDWKIVELNDQLNELTKERNRWDWHIQKVLGGPKPRNHGMVNGKVISGKRYFGRALELPEVQRVLREQKECKKTTASLVNVKQIPSDYDDDYYGTKEKHLTPDLQDFECSWTTVLRSHYDVKENINHHPLRDDSGIPNLKEMEKWLVERRKQKLLRELRL